MFKELEHWESLFEKFIQHQASSDAAHDLSHIFRVVHNAKNLAAKEGGDVWVIIPSSWLHDCVVVSKNSAERSQASRLAAHAAIEFLSEHSYPEKYYEAISHAIAAHSYSANIEPQTLEAKIIQDADRLDAIGAIGLSRCLMLGGDMGKSFSSTADPFCEKRVPDDSTYCLDHFFIKLLNLESLMKTEAGKAEAKKRTDFLRSYLTQLKTELNA